MSIVSRDGQVQVPLAHRTFDDLCVGTALMLNPPRCNARHGSLQLLPAVLVPLLVQGDFLGSWRREMLTTYALAGLVTTLDKTWQSVHATVLRSPVEGGVIDVRFACIVVSHWSKMDAPIRCKARISGAFGHWTPFFLCG
jgi:hypothetical protein